MPSAYEGLFFMFASLCTGTSLVLVSQKISSQGVHPSSQLVIWVAYAVQTIITTLQLRTSPKRKAPTTRRQKVLSISHGACHVFAYLMVMTALSKIGAAIYQIIYSSGIVWAAIVSRVVLAKVPSLQQGLAIVIVTAGLGVNGYSMLGGSSGSGASGAADMAIGGMLTLLITLLFVCMPVLAELANQGLPDQKKVTSLDIGNTTGLVGLAVSTVYVFLHTVPNWDTLVTQPLAAKGTPLSEVVMWYLGSAVLHNIHGYLFMETGRTCGAVGNGLVNALRSATVVIIGAFLFCSPEAPTMCLDDYKKITVAFLVLGGVVYTTAPPATYITAVKEAEKKKTGKAE